MQHTINKIGSRRLALYVWGITAIALNHEDLLQALLVTLPVAVWTLLVDMDRHFPRKTKQILIFVGFLVFCISPYEYISRLWFGIPFILFCSGYFYFDYMQMSTIRKWKKANPQFADITLPVGEYDRVLLEADRKSRFDSMYRFFVVFTLTLPIIAHASGDDLINLHATLTNVLFNFVVVPSWLFIGIENRLEKATIYDEVRVQGANLVFNLFGNKGYITIPLAEIEGFSTKDCFMIDGRSRTYLLIEFKNKKLNPICKLFENKLPLANLNVFKEPNDWKRVSRFETDGSYIVRTFSSALADCKTKQLDGKFDN